MNDVTLIATSKFGLEAVVKRELQALGFTDLDVQPGQIRFTAPPTAIPRANLWLRSADRLLLQVGGGRVRSFDDLFELTQSLPWEAWVPKDGRFPVLAKTHKSQLKSARSSQAIVKKAVAARLETRYGQSWFPETGPLFTIHLSILKDEALLAIDTSGAGLHKRGYRAVGGAAPLQETLAAALVQLSFWQQGRLLLDPLCGSGTILIEAALLGRNQAPGLRREFAAEAWPTLPADCWEEERAAAEAAIETAVPLDLHGSDQDPQIIAIAQQNAALAGVAGAIDFSVKPLEKVWIDQEFGVMITNPPYGERLSDYRSLNKLYITLNKMLRKKDGWSVYVLTGDKQFPRYFKRQRPNRVRKLYNGRIEVNYYQYHGRKPPAGGENRDHDSV